MRFSIVLFFVGIFLVLPSSTEVSSSGWRSYSPLPHPIYSSLAAAVDDLIYVMGGLGYHGAGKNNWRFNASRAGLLTSRWDTALTPLPEYVAKGGATVVDDVVYLVQAYDCLTYFPSQDAFQKIPDMPNYRVTYPAVSSVADLVVAIGGISMDTYMPVASVQTYNVTSGKWFSQNRMPTARGVTAVATDLKGLVHVVGGFDGHSVVSTHEVFDALRNSWTTMKPLPFAVAGSSAAVTSENKLYVIGGMDAEGNPLNTVWIYDLVSSTWSQGPSMSTARKFLSVVAVDQNIFALGGCNATSGLTGCTQGMSTVEYLPLLN